MIEQQILTETHVLGRTEKKREKERKGKEGSGFPNPLNDMLPVT